MRCDNDRYDQITEEVDSMGLDELCAECIRRGLLRENDPTDIKLRELLIEDRTMEMPCDDMPPWREDDGYKPRNREN